MEYKFLCEHGSFCLFHLLQIYENGNALVLFLVLNYLEIESYIPEHGLSFYVHKHSFFEDSVWSDMPNVNKISVSIETESQWLSGNIEFLSEIQHESFYLFPLFQISAKTKIP